MVLELNFLFGLLCLGLWCTAIRIATEPNMILEKVNDWLSENLPMYLYKPLIGCVYCMASIHGALLYLTYFNIGLIYLPLFMVCGIAVNALTYNLIDKLRA